MSRGIRLNNYKMFGLITPNDTPNSFTQPKKCDKKCKTKKCKNNAYGLAISLDIIIWLFIDEKHNSFTKFS